MSKGRQILLIEDDSLLSEMYLMVLQDNGFEVILIKDGRAALSQPLDNIDLVLLDIRIPEIDGLRVLEFYRKNGYKRPILILTNSPQTNYYEARDLGADDFLVKSHTDLEGILAAVNKHLRENLV